MPGLEATLYFSEDLLTVTVAEFPSQRVPQATPEGQCFDHGSGGGGGLEETAAERLIDHLQRAITKDFTQPPEPPQRQKEILPVGVQPCGARPQHRRVPLSVGIKPSPKAYELRLEGQDLA